MGTGQGQTQAGTWASRYAWLGRDRLWRTGARPCCSVTGTGAGSPGADMASWAVGRVGHWAGTLGPIGVPWTLTLTRDLMRSGPLCTKPGALWVHVGTRPNGQRVERSERASSPESSQALLTVGRNSTIFLTLAALRQPQAGLVAGNRLHALPPHHSPPPPPPSAHGSEVTGEAGLCFVNVSEGQ